MEPGILQDPAPQVMVFIPHTSVFTIPRQSVTVRGAERDWGEREEREAGGRGEEREGGRGKGIHVHMCTCTCTYTCVSYHVYHIDKDGDRQTDEMTDRDRLKPADKQTETHRHTDGQTDRWALTGGAAAEETGLLLSWFVVPSITSLPPTSSIVRGTVQLRWALTVGERGERGMRREGGKEREREGGREEEKEEGEREGEKKEGREEGRELNLTHKHYAASELRKAKERRSENDWSHISTCLTSLTIC